MAHRRGSKACMSQLPNRVAISFAIAREMISCRLISGEAGMPTTKKFTPRKGLIDKLETIIKKNIFVDF